MTDGVFFTIGGTTTTATPSVDEIYATYKRLNEEKDEIDRGLVRSLVKVIEDSGKSAFEWASILRINFDTFVAVLARKREPDAYFWSQVSRVFEPMRKPATDGGAK